jgi:hypothetical protein
MAQAGHYFIDAFELEKSENWWLSIPERDDHDLLSHRYTALTDSVSTPIGLWLFSVDVIQFKGELLVAKIQLKHESHQSNQGSCHYHDKVKLLPLYALGIFKIGQGQWSKFQDKKLLPFFGVHYEYGLALSFSPPYHFAPQYRIRHWETDQTITSIEVNISYVSL